MKNLDFDWLTDEFMLYCRSTQLGEKTMSSYEQTLHLFGRWCADELKIYTVDKITENVIRKYMLWLPMIIMLAVTLTALVQKIVALMGNPTPGNLLQMAFAAALFLLGIIVAVLGLKRLAEKKVAVTA